MLAALAVLGLGALLTGCGDGAASAPPPSGSPTTAAGPSTTPTSRPVDPSTTSASADGEPPRWRPTTGLTWQWQLSGPIDTTVEVDVFDVDLYETPDAVLDDLRARGRRLICYVNAGAFEPYRDDADRFDPSVLGRPLDGWPDERWLDIRRIDLLAPVLEERLATCAARGFDGVELDNVDGYANDSGFPLTREDQVAFNRFLASAAHRQGLAVGLKNALDLIPDLVGDFDFAVNEECAAYDECESLTPFVEQGKPVFHAEYDVPAERFCPDTTRLGLSSIEKRLELDAWRRTCP